MNFRLVIFKKRFPAIHQPITHKILHINTLHIHKKEVFIKNNSHPVITIFA